MVGLGPRAPRAVLLLCAFLAWTAPAAHAAARSRSATLAATALTSSGYDAVDLSCRARHGHSALCTWSGVRGYATCAGTVAVRRRKPRRVAMRTPECTPVLFGFNTYTNDLTTGLQRALGVPVQRMFVRWSQVQRAPGVWDWSEYDTEYKVATTTGIRPLVVADDSPCWARTSGACSGGAIEGPPDAARDADWREFLRRLTERYPAALGIEIWNEPNLTSEWSLNPNPERYAQLLQQAYETIKATNPVMPVVSGGLLANDVEGVGSGGMGDRTFVQRLFAAGAGRFMDAFGVHPYPEARMPDGSQRWDPAIANQTVADLRGIIAAAGFPNMPVWITEVGESTGSQPGFPAAVTPQQQAADLVRILQDAVRTKAIPVVVIHTLGDTQSNALEQGFDNLSQPTTGISVFYNGVGSGFGVYDSDNKPKPAACAISRELGGTLAC